MIAEEPRNPYSGYFFALGVPARYQAVSPEVAIPAAALSWEGDPWSLTILGPAGTGKTWIAVRILCELWGRQASDGFIRRCYRARFWDVSGAMAAMKAEFGTERNGETYTNLTESAAIVLDDLGAQRETDYTRDQVSLILRHRYNAMLPTIITSNATSLSQLGDQRVASRLSDGIVITLGGSDRRGKRGDRA